MDLFVRREIDRPAEVVFAFVSDVVNNPKWQRGQISCEWSSPAPIGVGSRYEQEARFLGRRVLSSFEVVELHPGRAITIQSAEGPFSIRVKRSVEPIGPGRSRITAEISGQPGGFFRIAGPWLARLAQRSVDADYDRLKRLLESD